MPQLFPIMLCSDSHRIHQLCSVFPPIMPDFNLSSRDTVASDSVSDSDSRESCTGCDELLVLVSNLSILLAGLTVSPAIFRQRRACNVATHVTCNAVHDNNYYHL